MDLGTTLGAISVILIISIALYKETIFFRIAEHALVGSTAGLLASLAIKTIRDKGITPLITQGDPTALITIILGLLIYTRLNKNYGWISRWPIAVIVGVGVGVAMRGNIDANIVGQISAITRSFLEIKDPYSGAMTFMTTIFTMLTLFYFSYTAESKGILGSIRRASRLILMAAFGTMFGAAVMTRTSYWLGSLTYLLFDWLGLG